MISDQARQYGVRPVWIALAVAAFGILAMLVVDHGPWAHPHLRTALLAHHYRSTQEAERAAGADVEPTRPNSAIEPQPPGPKQVEPPNPKPE